jgi:hypothetical protein
MSLIQIFPLVCLSLLLLTGCDRNEFPLAQVGKNQVNSDSKDIGKLSSKTDEVPPIIDPSRPKPQSTLPPKF